MTPPGDIRAYDILTGKLLWQFHTIPRPGEFGYETNPKDGWKYMGGANNWGEMSIDEARGIVYIPTGSATADFWGGDRHGQNLFANCILALDVRTGKRLWHFQTIHHDLWDLDNVSAPQLVTVRHNGQNVDVVAHAGKTGFLYVFNRVTGEPLWPIEERPVTKGEVPGEFYSPTQPFPTKPAPFVRQSYTEDDVNPHLLTPEQYNELRERVRNANNGTGPQGGLFVPTMLNGDAVSMPGNQGGSNWGTTAADPQRGLVFVTGVNQVAILRVNDIEDPTVGGRRGGGGRRQQQPAAQHEPGRGGPEGLRDQLRGLPRRGSARRRFPASRRSSASRIGSIRRACASSSAKAATTCARSSTRRTRTSRRFTPISRSRTRRGRGGGNRGRGPAMVLPPGSGRRHRRRAAAAAACALRRAVLPGRRRHDGQRAVAGRCRGGEADQALSVGLQRHGDVHQAAVHDDHGVRPEHRRDQVAGAERRRPGDGGQQRQG